MPNPNELTAYMETKSKIQAVFFIWKVVSVSAGGILGKVASTNISNPVRMKFLQEKKGKRRK